jgi:hypothetical protein
MYFVSVDIHGKNQTANRNGVAKKKRLAYLDWEH